MGQARAPMRKVGQVWSGQIALKFLSVGGGQVNPSKNIDRSGRVEVTGLSQVDPGQKEKWGTTDPTHPIQVVVNQLRAAGNSPGVSIPMM